MIDVKKITFADLSQDANFNNLVKEYYEETRLGDLVQVEVKVKTYHMLENAKTLAVFGAYADGFLIGFSIVVTNTLPHYGVQISITDALFVSKEYRASGAGLKLIHASEKYALAVGSPGIVITAPVGGPLVDLLPKLEYTPTNIMFYRSLKNE